VRFTVLDPAAVERPADLTAALAAESLTAAFESLPPGQRNFSVRKIVEAIKPQTRLKRIQEALLAARQRRAKAGD
jgi:uncharacterized protein YdeI (YjbR/CyaY-like superfamily)